MNNTSRNVYYEYGGLKKTVTEWARDLSINVDTPRYRIKKWGVERALGGT